MPSSSGRSLRSMPIRARLTHRPARTANPRRLSGRPRGATYGRGGPGAGATGSSRTPPGRRWASAACSPGGTARRDAAPAPALHIASTPRRRMHDAPRNVSLPGKSYHCPPDEDRMRSMRIAASFDIEYLQYLGPDGERVDDPPPQAPANDEHLMSE